MAEAKKLTGDNRIDFNWFSRKHETSAAHEENHKMWEEERGPVGRKAKADVRVQERASRSPQEQLALLDGRPGASAKERVRLLALISQQ